MKSGILRPCDLSFFVIIAVLSGTSTTRRPREGFWQQIPALPISACPCMGCARCSVPVYRLYMLSSFCCPNRKVREGSAASICRLLLTFLLVRPWIPSGNPAPKAGAEILWQTSRELLSRRLELPCFHLWCRISRYLPAAAPAATKNQKESRTFTGS